MTVIARVRELSRRPFLDVSLIGRAAEICAGLRIARNTANAKHDCDGRLAEYEAAVENAIRELDALVKMR